MVANFAKLSGEAVPPYVAKVTTALQRARLNRQYPDGRACADHIALMGPECHHGLYPDLELHPQSGLPSYREWVRVRTDREALTGPHWFPRPLAELQKKASENPHSVFGKQLLQHHYREALLKKKLVDFDHLDVQLMRISPNEQTAQFRVVMDKLSVAGTFSRTTIELSQTKEFWDRADLRLEGESVKHTESFRTLIYSMSSSNAELLFHRLEDEENLSVHYVLRGTIGPFFLPGRDAPDGFSELIENSNSMLATFSLDSASREQQEDRRNDPLADSLARQSDRLPEEILQSARAKHGYRVFQDRKFVTDAKLSAQVESMCQAMGTRNIVYKL